MEFKMQSIATPVSANTAIHIFANPNTPKIITNAFTARANTTFASQSDMLPWKLQSTLE